MISKPCGQYEEFDTNLDKIPVCGLCVSTGPGAQARRSAGYDAGRVRRKGPGLFLRGTVDTDITILRADSGQAPKAPGMKYRHYAPRGELTIVEGTPGQVREYINRATEADHTAGEKTGIIGTEEMLSGYIADVVKSVGSRKDEDSIARHLYTILREFDDEGVTKIYSEGFSTEGFGQAIMNRLLKAAGHKVVKL